MLYRALLSFLLCLPGVCIAAEPPSCVAPGMRAALAERVAAAPAKWQAIAREAGVAEYATLAVLPRGQAVGTVGAAFREVWDSLRSWPDAVVVIVKAEQVFEVHGRIPAGEPSKVSRYFNLDPSSDGITGHLRPDAYSAIFATSLPGRDRVQHGILFFDAAGTLIFGVYVPNEHATEDSGVLEAFRATAAKIAALPRTCPES